MPWTVPRPPRERYPVRGVFRLPPVGLRETVLHVLAEAPCLDACVPQATTQPLFAVVRQWKRDSPDQFAELAALIMNGPRTPVVLVEPEAA
jgi:hypothetical protein